MWSRMRSAVSSLSSRKSGLLDRRRSGRLGNGHRRKTHVCVLQLLEERRMLVTVTVSASGNVLEGGNADFAITLSEMVSTDGLFRPHRLGDRGRRFRRSGRLDRRSVWVRRTAAVIGNHQRKQQ
jgi:hypothetical protein